MARELHIVDLGILDYAEAMALQDRLVEARLRDLTPDRLLLLEHPRVFTFSRRAGLRHLLLSPDQVHERGIALCQTDRGGDITYHGPGQLVAYLIAKLEGAERNVPDLFTRIEEAVVEVCQRHGIASHGGTKRGQRGPTHLLQSGVWVGKNKICAIGMKLSQWITKHGLALNIDVTIEDYQMIVACGLAHRGQTSMHLEGASSASMKDVKIQLGQLLARSIGRAAVPVPRSSLDTVAQRSI